jgi:ribosome biogenesis GTPase
VTEEKTIKGQVLKAVAGQYLVAGDGRTEVCSVRGRVKKDVDIYVGDFVEFADGIITDFIPRKNFLIRPYIANIDALFIVVAPEPKPDWMLVEKLLLNCHLQKITPVIVMNKLDLGASAAEELSPYEFDVKTFCVSAKTGENIVMLEKYIQGKTVCFCGQSAVGKSSIINALGGTKIETGELSRKIKRGKNTTRHIEIYDICGGRAVDTCGFSAMEGLDVRPEDLTYFYDEFVVLQNKCRFFNCTHTTEPDCAVKKAVENGSVDRRRYDRYVALYNELAKRRKKMYE